MNLLTDDNEPLPEICYLGFNALSLLNRLDDA